MPAKRTRAAARRLLPALLCPWWLADAALGASCDALAAITLDGGTILSATTVPAGAMRREVAPQGFGAEALARAFDALPAVCRVTATLSPTADSAIGVEVWLPTDGWNGKLLAVGNGAWAGSISYTALADAVAAGYAASSTDTGHIGNSSAFALGHPEKLVDFAHRAVHEMTVAAKTLIAAHYEAAAARSYFVGCSTGGRQALAAAQRYPADFDGIVAGAPAYYPTHLQGAQIWTAIVGQRAPRAALAAEQLPLVNAAATAACDALDGVEDGVIENPAECPFDPATLVCAGSATGACLEPEQAETVRLIYRGPRSAAGRSLFPGVSPGSELGWADRIAGTPITLATETYRDLVFRDPTWDYRTFDPERDIARAVATIGALLDSTEADLTPFLERGGKLLLYHGWNDPGIPPLATVQYYERVAETVSPALADDGVRLFMVPGMNHCRGGVGTDRFDAAAAIDRWVTTGRAPARIEAAREEHGRIARTRPLCPYPQTAVYSGTGSTDDAASFVCR